MRSTRVWFMASAPGLALVGPAFARDAPAAGSTAAIRATRRQQLTGAVGSVDQAAKTFIVKRASSKTATDMTFAAERDAAAALAGRKPGGQVKVGAS